MVILMILTSNVGFAVTSESPKVKAMVKEGLATLEKNVKSPTVYDTAIFHTGGAGEHALAAYAYMKLTHDAGHPVVQQGIRSALRFVATASLREPGGGRSKTVYSTAVCTLLLAEVDRIKYRKELKQLEKLLRAVQFKNGAYGYLGQVNGDVSQTQYAILALWTLDNAGIVIDYEGVVRTIQWLLRVQDLSGAWPYMGIDPPGGRRIKQSSEVGVSMANAGGSALLIAADILQVWEGKLLDREGIPVKLPLAVTEFKEGLENAAIKRPEIPAEPILASIAECQAYLDKHGDGHVAWPYYNIYTTERFQSFQEIALKLPKKPNVPWYDAGVSFLESHKDSKGGWRGVNRYTSVSTATSFAILFLSRSTQKAIEQSQEGTLAGGFGLPGDTTKIRVDGTQIKGEPIAGAVTDLLDMLEGDDTNALEGKTLPEDMELATEPKARRVQLDRLERLVRGSSSWQARRVAARLLGQSDEIRVVPSLIFALDDPDTTVRTFARDGLRFISRKFEGFGMEIEPGEKQNYGDLRRAQRLWRQWYLTMDPGHIFITQ